MNTTELFNKALGLSSPWFIRTEVLMPVEASKEQELHIHLDFENGYKFLTASGTSSIAYDTEEKTRQHLNLNFFHHRCYLHARVPCVKDSITGKVIQVRVPCAR